MYINSIPVQLLTSRADSSSISNSLQKSTQFRKNYFVNVSHMELLEIGHIYEEFLYHTCTTL